MAKKGNNEGSVYKDKNGRWRGVVTLPTVDDKVKKKYFYGKTRKEVSDKVNTVINQLKNNTYLIGLMCGLKHIANMKLDLRHI